MQPVGLEALDGTPRYEAGAEAVAARNGVVAVHPSPAPVGISPTLVPRTEGGPAGAQAVLKRALDIVVSLVVLVLVLPVLLAAAVAVKVSSPGPILFRQVRVGRGGRHFRMLKFRTFPVDHVDRVQSVSLEECPLPIGRFLRRTSIDELPQLFNVLFGHMSLVGPRPERPQFAEPLVEDLPEYRERHRAPAGMTGLAQVMGLTGPTSIEERIAADNAYIDGWTIWRDLHILLRTVPAVLRRIRGASPDN